MLRTLLVAAALGLAGCATPAPSDTASAQPAAAERDCFRSDSVNGFNYVDQHHVTLHVSARRSYVLTTNWNARDLDWRETIALHSATGWICTGNGLGVEVSGGEPRRTYPISGIARAPEPAPQGS